MKNLSCPNRNLPEWKALVAKVGNTEAYRDYMETNGEMRSPEVVLAKLQAREALKRDLDYYQGDEALMDQEEGYEEEITTTPVQTEQILEVENAIKNELPIEIVNAVTVVQDVPLDILGRNDLFLSMKDIFEEKGITNPFLINWLGINLSSNSSREKAIKSIDSESQIEAMANRSYSELLKSDDSILKNKDIKESFDKWVKALKNYPVVFRDLMLKHAIKHLRNPERRAKFVLQLSDVALTQAYGIVVNKPHELNRIGKLYDQEVLKTVSDAVGHEPSASGKGYWVHIPRTEKSLSDEDFVRFSELINMFKNPISISNTFGYKNTRYFVEDGKIKKLSSGLALTSYEIDSIIKDLEEELGKGNNNAQYKVNVELLRKLSPSTWCTAASMAAHYVENYDNYLLVVNGITVAGVEAMPEEDNSDYLIQELENKIQNLENTESYTIDRNRIKGQPSTFTSVIRPFKGDIIYLKTNDREEINAQEEDAIKKINEDLQKEIRNLKNTIKTLSEEIKLRKVKEVTSRGNNGVSSIDHYDDILAFFEKHNLDTDNASLQGAKNAKDKGKVDKDLKIDYDLEQFGYELDAEREEREAIDRHNGEYEGEYEIEPHEWQYDYEERRDEKFGEAQTIHTIQGAIDFVNTLDGDIIEAVQGLEPRLLNNEQVASLLVEKDAHNIVFVNHTLPFYKELAHKAVVQNNATYHYISEEAKEEDRNKELWNEHLIRQHDNLNDDLPFSKTASNQIQGYYDAKNDKVVVVAKNTPTNEAAKVAIHEVAHRGMIRMAKDLGGTKELNQILLNAEKELMKALPELLKRTGHKSLENLMLDYGFDKNSKEGKFKLLMELAARWAETLVNKPKPSWWKQLVQDIRKWIKKFTNRILSEQEVNELVGGFVRYGTKTKQTKVKEPTAISKFKDAIGLNESKINGDQLVWIQRKAGKYNKKNNSSYKVSFKPIGQTNTYTYTIEGKGPRTDIGVQTAMFYRPDDFISAEGIKYNSSYSSEAYSRLPLGFDQETNENTLGEKLISNLNERLSQNLGINYENVSPEKAAELTEKANIQWNGEPAFFIGNVVYFVGNNIKSTTQLHEFSHPLVRAIKASNPKLFDKLYNDLKNTSEGKEIIAMVEEKYPEYKKDDSDFMEEAVVRSLTKAADLVRQKYQGSSGFIKAIKDFLYQIKKALRQLFGKIRVENLDVNTTIDQLADMLHNDFFDIKSDIISEKDIVAFNRLSQDLRDDLNKMITEDPTGLQMIADQMFKLSSNHLDKLVNDKDYKGLEDVVKDALSRNEIEEMKKSLSAYQTVLINKANKIKDEVNYRKNQVGVIVQNLERMNDVTKRVADFMKILSKEETNPDKVNQMHHYALLMKDNEKFIDQVSNILNENDLRDTPIGDLVASIKNKIESSKQYTSRVYSEGVVDTLYTYVEQLVDGIESRHKEILDYYAKSGAPKSLVDRENRRYETMKMDKDKFRALIHGDLGDAGALSTFFESYMGSPDPVIASFGLYVKKHIYDVLYKMRERVGGFTDDLVPALEKAGYSGNNPEKFFRSIVTLNKKFKLENDKVLPDQFEYSLMAPVYNFEHWYSEQAHTSKLLKAEALESGDYTKYDEFQNANALYKEKYFNKKYSDEYYALDKIYDESKYGDKARELIDSLYKQLNYISQDNLKNLDELEKSKEKEVVLRKIRQLSSLRYENGTPKVPGTEDYEIASVIKKYRDASRPFYTYVDRENAFQTALSRYEESLIVKGMDRGSNLFNTAREKFILANTDIAYTDDYFDTLSDIGRELDEVLSNIPAFKNKEKIKKAFEEISEALIGYKDENNQPIATDMSEERIQRVKTANILIDDLRTEFGGITGMTPEQWDRYNELWDIIRSKKKLSKSEQDEFDTFEELKGEGLTKIQKARLSRVYAKFSQIRKKEATQYYLDAFNFHLQNVNTDELNEEIGNRIVDVESIELILENDELIQSIISQDEDFKQWFEKNHYTKSYFSYEKDDEVITHKRVGVWSVNRPVDDIHYKKTDLKDADGNIIETINRVPSFRFKDKVVNDIVEIKDDYGTVIKTINNITPKIVGETVDNRNRWLPLSIEQGAPKDSPFINNEYYTLKANDDAKFKVLEILTKFHLLNQEGLDKGDKLYLSISRFGKDLSEKILGGVDVKEKKSKLSEFVNGVKEMFAPTKDDYDRGLNFKKENQYQLMAADMFDDEASDIAIHGLADIDFKHVSLDLPQSLIKYGLSAEKQKKLTEIWPIAKALSDTLNDPKTSLNVNNIVKKQYLARNSSTPPNKKNRTNRAKAVDNFIDKEFKGINLTGLLSDNAFAVKTVSNLMKAASFGFFGLDLGSASINTIGMYFQSTILAAGGRYLNEITLADGTLWANTTVMKQITMGIYKKGQNKPLELQMSEVFDIAQGRLDTKMSESMSRTLGRDLMNLSFFYSPRRFGELQNANSMFGGFMKHKMIDQTIGGVTKKIAYRDAWKLKDGKLTLTEGIDKDYDVGGKEFTKFRNLMQEKMRTMGSVSHLDTPELNRYLVGKMVGFLRSFLTPMITSRLAFKGKIWNPQERYNLASGDEEMGTYIRVLKELGAAIKYGGQNLRYMNKENKHAFMRVFTEIGMLLATNLALGLLFGWDPDDEDRYAKMRKRSGALPLPWVDDESPFHLTGWLTNHAVYELLKVRAENEAFLPWPGFGLDDYSRLISIDSGAVFGSTIVNYGKAITNLVAAATGDKSAYYQRAVGPYSFQQEDQLKALNYLAKSFGFSGKGADPVMATKNFVSVQSRIGGGSKGSSKKSDDNEDNSSTYLIR